MDVEYTAQTNIMRLDRYLKHMIKLEDVFTPLEDHWDLELKNKLREQLLLFKEQEDSQPFTHEGNLFDESQHDGELVTSTDEASKVVFMPSSINEHERDVELDLLCKNNIDWCSDLLNK